MSAALDSHLRDLESEARQAEKEADEFRERGYQRFAELNQNIADIVAKIQLEKEEIKERTARKEEWARRKLDEYLKFKASLSGDNLQSAPISVYQPTIASTRPSIRSEQTRTSHTSLDDVAEPNTPIPSPTITRATPTPRSAKVKTPKSPPAPTGIVSAHKYIDNCPVIVKDTTGNWVEIRCFLCGGNSLDKKGWIRGARGMLAHIGKSHRVISHEDRKLDSTNLLEYCTVRQVLDDELNDIIDMSTDIQIKMIPCRDLDAATPAVGNSDSADTEQVDAQPTMPSKIVKLVTKQPLKLAVGGKSVIKIANTKLPGKAHTGKNQPGLEGEEDETDEAFDYLLPYPTIVCRPDKTWVELRCDVCGGNSIANSDRRYAHGVVGFNRHLSRGHGQKSVHTKTRLRLEEVLKRCTYREVPAEEIESLSENNADTIGIEKISFTQTAVTTRKSTGSVVESASAKRPRPLKRTYTSEPEETEVEREQNDSDFDPSANRKLEEPTTKRARHSVSSATTSIKALARSTRRSRGSFSYAAPVKPPKRAEPENDEDDHHSPNPAEDSTIKQDEDEKAAPAKRALDKYCPCTVGGHECKSDTCQRVPVCLKSRHDDDCYDDDDSHAIKPSCVMAVLAADCPEGSYCSRGHDHLEQRQMITRTHDCINH